MLARRSVLIVDESEETRAVLRAALEQRGADIIEASRAEQGLALAQQHHPDVIVLDLEIDSASHPQIAAGFTSEADTQHTPLVLLGSARRERRSFPTGQFVAKPYHYGPLIRRIEQLLDQAQQPLARVA